MPRLTHLSAVATVLSCLAAGPAVAQTGLFERGDTNADAVIDISDTMMLLDGIFLNAGPFPCADAADADDNGRLNVSDAVYLLRYTFLGESAPPPPFAGCGADPSDDGLPCEAFERCDAVEGVCLTRELLDDTLGPLPGFELCLPAGILNLELEGFEVAVCPETYAPPCGLTETPGCPIELTGFVPFVDFDAAAVGIRVEGLVEDLPIQITEGLLGTTTTCETDLRGDDDEDLVPFSFEIVFGLETEAVSSGVRRITGIGEGEVANIDIVVDASGGFVCTLFEAAQGVFVQLLVAPLAEVVAGLADGLGDGIVGLNLCE